MDALSVIPWKEVPGTQRRATTLKDHHAVGITANPGAPPPCFPPPRISGPFHGPLRGLPTEIQRSTELTGSIRN